MQLFGSLSILLSITATISTFVSASPVRSPSLHFESKRLIITPNDLYQDITNIHNAVLANQQATLAFQGGNVVTTLVQGAPVIGSIAAIHTVNRKGFVDANLSGPIGEADTKRIVDHTVATVGVSIPDAVDILVSKKQQFVASGQRLVTLGSLKLLLDDHDTFSAALLAKAYKENEQINTEANDVVARIHNAIQGGIDAYSS